MSNSSRKVWKTKFGSRRVRVEAPTLEEAIAAAQGLTDDVDAQAEIAASLIGMPIDQVRATLVKSAAPRKALIKSVIVAGPGSAPRTVAVERKPARRVAAAARAGRAALGDSAGL